MLVLCSIYPQLSQAQSIVIPSSESKTIQNYQIDVVNKITEIYSTNDDSELLVIIKRGHSSLEYPTISATSADEQIIKSILNYQMDSDTLRMPYNHRESTFSIDLAIHLTGENCQLDNEFTYNFVNEAPVVENQTFVIAENSKEGTEIGPVIGSDPDNDELVYAIQNNGAYAGILDLDPATGIITLLDSAYNDFESIQQYLIRVEAYDTRLRGSGLITINVEDVNEAPTVAATQSVEIDENTEESTVLGTLNVSDPEGDAVTYTIKETSLEGALSISESGEILVENASLLDYETSPEISITAEVSDGEFAAQSVFNVSLKDVNEAPSLSAAEFQVDDIAEEGTVVGQLEAADPEEDEVSFSMTSSSEFFAISEAGVVTLIKAPGASMEDQSFDIDVSVSDGELTSSGTVNIKALASIVASIEEALPGIKIYPNPVKDFLTIEMLTGQITNTKFQLFNANGIQYSTPSTQTIYDQNGMDVSDLPKGIYLLTISNNNVRATLKILKD